VSHSEQTDALPDGQQSAIQCSGNRHFYYNLQFIICILLQVNKLILHLLFELS